jgi:acyl-CoA thioesterase-1
MKIRFRGLLLATLAILYVPAAASAQVAVIGDSNVAGKGVASSDNYTAQLQRAMRGRGYKGNVVNAGINGDTTQGVLNRLDRDVPPGTKVAVVWVGANDRKAGVPREQIIANKKAIAARLRARGIKVVMVGPKRVGGLHDRAGYVVQGDPQRHLNSAGYSAVVGRTLSDVQTAASGTSRKQK